MKSIYLVRRAMIVLFFSWPFYGNVAGGADLKVHIAQANNESPYVFVRAKFEPGELSNPWSARFIDEKGAEVPYFVWDSVTWRVAKEGREDWGKRFALLNHAPGDAPEAVNARGEKLKWARQYLPELAAKLDAQDAAAQHSPDSICAAMYLLRYHVPAYGKVKLTLHIAETPAEPKREKWNGQKVDQRVSVRQGDLAFNDLPDRLTVAWKGKEIYHYAGSKVANVSEPASHADPSRPWSIVKEDGIITKLSITGQTNGRNGSPMNWQCVYWLFPEGSYVGLEGYSLDDATNYRGGPQKLTVWQSGADFSEEHKPSWETPWWLHHAGPNGFVATHLLYATPLTIGYCNNPFTINTERNNKEPNIDTAGNSLTLGWSYEMNDEEIARVQSPEPMPHRGMRPDMLKPAPAQWKPKIDWLYRQYLVGVADQAQASEKNLRSILGAAAGWIDRPIDEESVATTLVEIIKKLPVENSGTEYDQLMVATAVLNGGTSAGNNYLGHSRNQAEKADFYINLIREFVARGGKPAGGSHLDKDGVRREGWTGNPCYFAHLLPDYLHVFDYFDLSYRKEEYRAAMGRFADFSLELLGGKPFDLGKFNSTMTAEWPSRVVPIIPLMIGAYDLRHDETYRKAAVIMFDDLMGLAEKNPHGYFPVWTFNPHADHWDTVYNPVSYSRGLASFWMEQKLDWIGRQRASNFVAAQVRWMVFSGQFLDTLEMDNVCAIRAATHHGHTNSRTQIGLYLYDDFDFYRGLVGGVIDWSAATWQKPDGLFPIGTGPYRALSIESPVLRWALDLQPGAKAVASKVSAIPGGFKVDVWNRLAEARPAINITAKDAGLQSSGEVIWIQPLGPAYRTPATYNVDRQGGAISIKASRPAMIRVNYAMLKPEWADATVVLRQKHGADVTLVAARRDPGVIEWRADAGEYVLEKAK